MKEITVRVIDRKRKNFYMRAEMPDGSRQERSTGVKAGGNRLRLKAERVAADWQKELRQGQWKPLSKVTWEEFRERYEREGLSDLTERTAQKVSTAFNQVEDILSPLLLTEVTTDRLSHFKTVLQERGQASDTIKGTLAHLKAALRWAGDLGILNKVPKIRMPKRAKGEKAMKGRAITGEEFDRMLSAVPLVFAESAESWAHMLRGLWWSGLRLEESLNLSWDLPDTIRIDADGRYVMLWIPADNEKGNKDRLYPVAPEFAEMLLAVPVAERTGRLFQPVGKRGGVLSRVDTVSKKISSIGERANVVVNSDGGKTKYASAQDLRRAFGFRWSERIMPAQLKELMRHEEISTTMKYYVGRNAEATAASLYRAIGRGPETARSGDSSGDTWTTDGPKYEESPTQL